MFSKIAKIISYELDFLREVLSNRLVISIGMPAILINFFLLELNFNHQIGQETHFFKFFNPKTNELSISMDPKVLLENLNQKKALELSIPEAEIIAHVLNVPPVLLENEFCIGFRSFDHNIDEELIPSDNALAIGTGSTTIARIPSGGEECFPELPQAKMFTYIMNEDETMRRISEWGFERGEIKILSSIDKVTYRAKPKYFSVLIVVPGAIFATWWGFLILFSKMYKDFIKAKFDLDDFRF